MSQQSPFKFVHVTDTHLISPGNLLHTLDPAKRFASCIDSINQSHADAACMVVTGDLADRGEESAYQLLAAELERCNLIPLLVVGNHDSRENFGKWFPQVCTDEHGFIQYVWESAVGVFILLDTVKLGVHSGQYCEKRQQWLRDRLEQYADKPVYLFMHHPPFAIHLPSIDVIGLGDSQAFAEIVLPHKNIRHIFFGHAHRPLSGNWNGISFSSLRGTNHQVALDFHSPEISYVDEPPEYAVVFLSDNQVVVHTHAYPIR